MNMPKSISTWLLIVFFVLEALAGFEIFDNGIVSGIVALAAAVAFFLARSVPKPPHKQPPVGRLLFLMMVTFVQKSRILPLTRIPCLLQNTGRFLIHQVHPACGDHPACDASRRKSLSISTRLPARARLQPDLEAVPRSSSSSHADRNPACVKRSHRTVRGEKSAGGGISR